MKIWHGIPESPISAKQLNYKFLPLKAMMFHLTNSINYLMLDRDIPAKLWTITATLLAVGIESNIYESLIV